MLLTFQSATLAPKDMEVIIFSYISNAINYINRWFNIESLKIFQVNLTCSCMFSFNSLIFSSGFWHCYSWTRIVCSFLCSLCWVLVSMLHSFHKTNTETFFLCPSTSLTPLLKLWDSCTRWSDLLEGLANSFMKHSGPFSFICFVR